MERIVKFTEIFVPECKKIRKKIRSYNEKAIGEVGEIENENTRA